MWESTECTFSLCVLATALLLIIQECDGTSHGSICERKECHPQTLSNDSYILQYCDEHHLVVEGRCCLNTTGHQKILIGADLGMCNISGVDGLFPEPEITTIQLLVLANNPIKNVSQNDFAGYDSLNYLELPSGLDCPGGHGAWLHTEEERNHTVCTVAINICQAQNFTCPENAHCSTDGPGLVQCLCDAGYSGYKCLRMGGFPVAQYTIGVLASTLVMAAFLWTTQRRHMLSEAEMGH